MLLEQARSLTLLLLETFQFMSQCPKKILIMIFFFIAMVWQHVIEIAI
jgi:hypothetical protein